MEPPEVRERLPGSVVCGVRLTRGRGVFTERTE